MNMEKIAKYIGLLFMMMFLTSCPVLEPNDDHFIIYVQNMITQKLCIDTEFNIKGHSYIESFRDSVNVNTKCELYGIGYDIPENPFDILISDFTNKHIIVTTTSGDTLANWNDSSAVFNQQYWLIEHQENGDVHCTLQLTDEVLKLK